MPLDPEQQLPPSPRIRHVIAPERGVDMSEPGPGSTPEKKKSKKGLVVGLTSGLAGAAIAAGAIIGINAGAEPPRSQPTAETPVDPNGEVLPEQPSSPELTVEAVEIPAGLPVEEVGALLIDRFDAWQNHGTNDEAVDRERTTAGLQNVSMGDFVTGKAEEYAAIYAAALYVQDWQSREDLVKNYDFGVRVNASTLELNLKTNDPVYGDEEAFQRNIHFEGAREISSGDGTRVIEIDYTESINADRNRVGEAFGLDYANFSPQPAGFRMTLVTIDGRERIAATEGFAR